MRRLAATAAFIALLAPASGRATGSGVSYAFGRTGGNIAPFTVTISSSGQVRVVGPVHPTVDVVDPAVRARLARLVKTTGFFALPKTTRCKGALPDFASDVITVRLGSASRTVLVHGDCSPRFATLYRALGAAVGVP